MPIVMKFSRHCFLSKISSPVFLLFKIENIEISQVFTNIHETLLTFIRILLKVTKIWCGKYDEYSFVGINPWYSDHR
jgi:hypothetical protein